MEKRPPLSRQTFPGRTLVPRVVARMVLPNQNCLMSEVGAAGPPGCPQIPPKPFCAPPGHSRTPSPPAGLARRSWGSRKGDRALAQDVARAPQLRPPGCQGRDAGAGMPVPVPCPCSPLLGCSPGTRINCSCFPSLTALLLAGTNCESPQGPTARPARGVPPAPGLCYPEFRISCSRRVEGGGRFKAGGPGGRQRGHGHRKGPEPFSAWNLSSCFLSPLCPPSRGGHGAQSGPRHELGVPSQCGGGLEHGSFCPGSQGALGGVGLLQESLRVLGWPRREKPWQGAEPSQSCQEGAAGFFLFLTRGFG